MREETMFVRSDGSIEIIGSSDLELGQLGVGTRRRASRIVPLHKGKRFAFLLLRALFGENGITAEWTREWQGPWAAVVFATGEAAVFESREEALQWEHERLEEYLSTQ